MHERVGITGEFLGVRPEQRGGGTRVGVGADEAAERAFVVALGAART
ncbi:hypothetical protein V2I01_20625 [Micromonospora sp. BRA006-A]|nr:hypothetical protein [Micromonospora sp. BRA006-A]